MGSYKLVAASQKQYASDLLGSSRGCLKRHWEHLNSTRNEFSACCDWTGMRRQHDLTVSCPQVVLLKRYLREKHVAVNHSRGYLLMRTMCPEMVASMTLVLVGHDNEPMI